MSTNIRVKTVRHAGVREFRDRATGLLREAEPTAVERHGKVIGFYIPVEAKRGDEEELKEALVRLWTRASSACWKRPGWRRTDWPGTSTRPGPLPSSRPVAVSG